MLLSCTVEQNGVIILRHRVRKKPDLYDSRLCSTSHLCSPMEIAEDLYIKVMNNVTQQAIS